jgi:Zn-dependent protease
MHPPAKLGEMSVVRWLFPFAQGLGLGVLAMLVHECGHLIAAFMLGLKIKGVGMRWNKGLYTVRQHGTPLQNLLVSAAGPLTNALFLAFATSEPLFRLANFCYAMANMLPIEGSDGYRIAICWQHLRSRQIGDK